MPLSDGPQMFLRQQLAEGVYVTKFSVPGPSSVLLKGRSIVTHSGLSPYGGIWHCSKDQSRISCVHTMSARAYLSQLVPQEGSCEDSEEISLRVVESISMDKLCMPSCSIWTTNYLQLYELTIQPTIAYHTSRFFPRRGPNSQLMHLYISAHRLLGART